MKEILIKQVIILMELIMKEWEDKKALKNKYESIEYQLKGMLEIVKEELKNINEVY